MATYSSNQVLKKARRRGSHSGQLETVSGSIRVGTSTSAAASSIATTDLIRGLLLGENIRPVRVIIESIPLSGTPVLTNPTFAVGVADANGGTFTRPNGDTYAAATTLATALVTSMVVPAANEITSVAVSRPVADSVSKYAPFYVTLTPAGAGAFSVAGGDIELKVTVEFYGENKIDAHVYTTYQATKVS